ncbi:retrotransposon protein, putative, ty1-copia subclass [Tanacetum coccineum]
MGNVPVLVKLHNVPITAFSEDGLSAIAAKLGTPLMLDSFTSAMCMESWCRSSFARAMIELRADVELKDTIVTSVPKLVGDGKIMDGKLVLVDDVEKPLKKVKSLINLDSESKMEEVFNVTIGFMASTTLKSGSESE